MRFLYVERLCGPINAALSAVALVVRRATNMATPSVLGVCFELVIVRDWKVCFVRDSRGVMDDGNNLFRC